MKKSLSFFKLKKIALVTIILVFCCGSKLLAQSKDSISTTDRNFKNTVKINISNWVLYDNSLQLSYERIIKENQSIVLYGGYQTFQFVNIDFDNANVSKDNNRSGYSLGAEYRFYLGSINKYKAPRGVYLAPFVSYFQFDSDRNVSYTNPDTQVSESLMLNTQMNFTSVGGILGYQFVIHDRWVIDCVLFGPSMTRYSLKAKLNGNIDGLDEDSLAAAVIEKLKEKIPFFDALGTGEEVAKKGVQNINAVGFRYSISIGYRF